MWKSLSIAQKVWLSFSILLMGYLFSIVLGFRLGKQTETRLRNVSESLFTASSKSQVALTAFNEQIDLYNDVIFLEDNIYLESSEQKAQEAQQALQTIIDLKAIDLEKRSDVRETLKDLRGFTAKAQTVYAALNSDPMFLGDAVEDVERQAMELTQQTTELQETLRILAQTFSEDLKRELANISETQRQRVYVEMLSFVGVVLVALSMTAFFLRRSLLNPIRHLAAVASKIAVGDLSVQVEVESHDELGMVANAFHDMIVYIQDIAQIAQRVAVGDIDVQVRPQSERDVLNQAIAETIQYIQNVADIAEKISRKELHVDVTPQSDQDVLNLSFQRMVRNIGEMMDEIHASMTSVQQQHWIRTGQTELNEQMRGEQDVATLAEQTITYLVNNLKAQIGAIYLLADTQQELELVGHYAYVEGIEVGHRIPVGVGLVGQAAREKRRILFGDVPETYLAINSGIGNVAPKHILVMPFLYEEQVKGVIELGTVHEFTELELSFLDQVVESIAIAFHSAQARVKMQGLLGETQSQAAELRAQQTLLEKANSELTQVEEDLRRANLQLQEASQHKSDFLANMSHELRTPLNSIIGFTSITMNALKDSVSPEHLQNLMKSEQAARILLQLINDILDFSKIEAGQMEIFIEEFQIEDLLDEVIVTGEGLLLEKPVELRMEIAPDLPEIVENDYIKVKQVLNNLLSNAIKFTNEGSVTIRAYPIDQPTPGIHIDVADTGCGIPDDKLATVFESFKQVDGTIKKRFGGTGLGLAISKQFCNMLGIDIGVHSQVNAGTTFWLKIPIAFHSEDVQLSQEAVISDAARVASESPEAEVFVEPEITALALCFTSMKICKAMKKHLMGMPLEFRHVQSVAECVELVRRHLVWTILIEPDEAGFDILARVKQEPSLMPIPTILCSMDAEHHHAPPLGPIEHISKPVDWDRLIQTLLRMTKQQNGDVLAVDDDAHIRSLYEQVLSNAGYQPHLATNGVEAVQFLRTHHLPQAILLDLLMPKMDGFQVLEQIQAHKAWRRVPIIVVTGVTLSPQERKVIQQGAQMLLEKGNFPMDDLPTHIHSLVHAVTMTDTQSILVIDDNVMNLDLMAGVFRTAGFTVYTSESGEEGVEIATSMVPDVVLMDLAMPGMDGFEATQHLKHQPATAGITVIACSALATKDFQERAYQVGCEGYITKPIEPDSLVQQVEKLVLSSKIRKRIAGATRKDPVLTSAV